MGININDFSSFDIDNFVKEINISRVIELLEDPENINEASLIRINEFKENILSNDILNLNDDNILSDIELIIYSMPNDIKPLEKVRWIYMGLGKLFSYDYRVADDIKYGKEKVINPDICVGRYQTCIQISEILNKLLNNIDGVSSTIIERKLDALNNSYGDNHVAIETKVQIDKDYYETYLLDLTLDLYLIQSGCKTEHFGYESGINGEYDVIPQTDNYKMDTKLGFMNGRVYTNEEILRVKEELNNKDYSNMTSKEILEDKILTISSLIKTFPGYHEGKRYIDMLFSELLKANYREFNINSNKDLNTNLKTCYMLQQGDYVKWIIYSNRIGCFIATDENGLKNMLDNEWETRSVTLKELVLKK